MTLSNNEKPQSHFKDNDKLNLHMLHIDREKYQKETVKKAYKAWRDELSQFILNPDNNKEYDQAIAAAEMLMMDRPTKYFMNWREAYRKKLYKSGGTWGQLRRGTRKMDFHVANIIPTAAINHMKQRVRNSRTGRMGVPEIGQMVSLESNMRVSMMSDILIENFKKTDPRTSQALLYAFGVRMNEEFDRIKKSNLSTEEKQRQIITIKDITGLKDDDHFLTMNWHTMLEVFSNEIEAGKSAKKFVWFAINMQPKEKRVEFGKTHIENKKLNISQTMKFLNEGTSLGAFSPLDRKKILESAAKLSPAIDDTEVKSQLEKNNSDSEQKRQAEIWKAQRDFTKEAQSILRQTMGAKNSANEMITGKNTVLFALDVMAVGTIGVNIIGNAANAGKLKDIKEMGGMVNLFSTGAGAYLFGRYGIDSKEDLESKDVRTREDQRSASDEMRNTVMGNLNWRHFLEDEEAQGVKALAEYTDYLRATMGFTSKEQRIPFADISPESFKTFLNFKMKEDPDSYAPVLEKFQEFQKPNEEFKNNFQTLIRSFDILQIRKAQYAKDKYNKILES